MRDLLLTCALLSCGLAVPAATGQDGKPATPDDPGSGEPRAAETVTRIEGQLVDAMGRGVQGARVLLLSAVEDQPLQEITTTTTNDIGDFLIELAGARTGSFVLRFSKSGFTATEEAFEIHEDDLEPFVDAMLRGDLKVRGEVVDVAELQPVRGAQVRLRTVYDTMRAETDDRGRFEFEQLISGDARLIVDAAGFGSMTQEVSIELLPDDSGAAGINGQAVYRVVLLPEKVLHLTVLDPQQQPIEGASVELRVTGFYRAADTDASGTVEVRGIPGDTLRLDLRLTHRDYVSSGAYDRDIHFADDQFRGRETAVMQPGVVLRGRVLTAGTREPLNGARVTVGSSLLGHAPHTFTNLAGRFEIASLAPGPQVVTVHLPGFAPQLVEVSVAPQPVGVSAVLDQPGELDIAVGDGRTVTGTVNDPDGQPLGGAEVMGGRWRGHHTLGLAALSDTAGRFVLENAPRDTFEVDVLARGTQLRAQTISGERNDYTFQLEVIDAADPGTLELCQVKAGDACPDFKLTSLDGTRWTRTQLAGKWVLLDFWATWCGPCIQDMPTLKRIHATYGKRGDFVLLGISRDSDESTLKRFLESQALGWPQVYGSAAGGDQLAETIGLTGIPCTLLIAPDGKLAAVGLTGQPLERRISAALDGEVTE